jgi:hypothetical protein
MIPPVARRPESTAKYYVTGVFNKLGVDPGLMRWRWRPNRGSCWRHHKTSREPWLAGQTAHAFKSELRVSISRMAGSHNFER